MIIGIDPGLAGAIAWLDDRTHEIIHLEDMPTTTQTVSGKQRRSIDAHKLVDLLIARPRTHAIVEQVGVRPGEGAVGAFAFGQGFGLIVGILTATQTPYELVGSATWKKAAGLIKAHKDESRIKAKQLWPANADLFDLKKHDGRAEAALIAKYGQRGITK